jgi:hypothetical protein
VEDSLETELEGDNGSESKLLTLLRLPEGLLGGFGKEVSKELVNLSKTGMFEVFICE